MSATHDIPCTVSNMNHWIDLIHEDDTFIQRLDPYQVSRTKAHLRELIQELQQQLVLLQRANPQETFSFPDLEMYLDVLTAIEPKPGKDIQAETIEPIFPFNDAPEGLRISKDRFEQIEKWLIAQKYLTEDGRWNDDGGKTKQELAALIQFWINKDIFGSLKKDNRSFRSKIRKTFEERYKFESIAEQFKPTDIRHDLMKQFEPGLSAIINPTQR